MPPDPKAATRIRCIDWLRGLAVLVMIECHCLVLLSASHDQEPLRLFLNNINGLVAPSFIFAAGFALALVLSRASSDPAQTRKRAVKSLTRIGQVLLVSKVLTWNFHAGDPGWIYKPDVLSCIGISLLLLLPLLLAGAGRPKVIAGASLAIALAIFLLTPFCDNFNGGWWKYYISTSGGEVWTFPLVPWAGYVFAGAAAGAWSSLGPKQNVQAIVGIVVLGAIFIVGGPLWPGNPFYVVNCGERLVKFGAAAVAFLGLERLAAMKGWALKNPAIYVLETFGVNSLIAWTTHLWLLFIPFPIHFTFAMKWSGQPSWAVFWLLTGIITALTLGVCVLLPKIMDRLSRKRKPQVV